MSHWIVWPGVFILGTIVGSFLTVCVHRVPKGQSVDGRVFRRLPDESISRQPMASKSSGLPEVQGWSFANRKAGTRGSHVKYVASLRLEFGQPAGDKLGGTIYLCVPKGQKSTFDKTPTAADSYAIGAFEATRK